MDIKIYGHNEENAVREVIMSFFTNLEGISVESSLTQNDGRVLVFTKIKIGENEWEENYTQRAEDDRQIRNAIKKSAFLCAKKISKNPVPWGILTGIRPVKAAFNYFKEGYSKEEVKEVFKNEYFVSDEKTDLVLKIYEKEKEIIKNMNNSAVSLYIGIPFCPSRCVYCSFLSSSSFTKGIFQDYLNALIKEIGLVTKHISDLGKRVETIYFGGGTPTVATSSDFKRIFDALYKNIKPDGIKEITVEAGRPDTIDYEKLKTLKELGTTRIGINPQSMNDETLKTIGRNHTREDILKAFEIAREAQIPCINSDVIAGLPNETLDDFKRTLDEVISLSPENISVHTMYIKRASKLKEEITDISMDYHKEVTNMIHYAYNRLSESFYEPYYMYKQKRTVGNLENIGFSKEGFECLYNIYMMEEFQTVIGLGAGSTTKILYGDRHERFYNVKEVREYILRLDEQISKKLVSF